MNDREPPRIFYVCAYCYNDAPEGCGREDPAELRLAPNGRQVCQECVEAGEYADLRVWVEEGEDDGYFDSLHWESLEPIKKYREE